MSPRSQRGSTLAVGLMILSLVTLLALAGASSAHVERLLAQNETFRENAASAASAGIEMGISAILDSANPEIATDLTGRLPGPSGWFEASVRFAGYEESLPQEPGGHLAGAHYEIVVTGHAARRALSHQRARVMRVVDAASPVIVTDCAPLVARECHVRGELERLSWQSLPAE